MTLASSSESPESPEGVPARPAWSDTQPLFLPWLRPEPVPGPPSAPRPAPPPSWPQTIDSDVPNWPEQTPPCHPIGWTVFFHDTDAGHTGPNNSRRICSGVVAGMAVRDPATNIRRTPIAVSDPALGDRTVLVADSAITVAMPGSAGPRRG